MYNTKFNCTYNTLEVFLDTDNVTINEKNFIRDTLYRQELLNILEMDEYSEPEMNRAIHELYERIKECTDLTNCMRILAGRFISEDKEFGLMVMFCYDYMYLTHICISEFLDTGKISKKSMNNMKNLMCF